MKVRSYTKDNAMERQNKKQKIRGITLGELTDKAALLTMDRTA